VSTEPGSWNEPITGSAVVVLWLLGSYSMATRKRGKKAKNSPYSHVLLDTDNPNDHSHVRSISIRVVL
jgi:hypothetical protein